MPDIQKSFDAMGVPESEEAKKVKKAKVNGGNGTGPINLGKVDRLDVPDFNDPNRPPVCLEIDFPIAPINALSNLEGNAGKPIYQMSKWWARRRSSVFRSLMIAAALQAPEDHEQAAKLVWDHYYANHQKAKNFTRLRVLEPFMGGGTTLVEGARLGFHVSGVDLNPVAWFVSKNEVASSDPEDVRRFFAYIEAEVKPQIMPFYTTTCPREHQGRWIDVETGAVVSLDPIHLAHEERKRYRWEGPEIIYTFWAKHGPCQAYNCGHRTPIFKSPVIAEKRLTTKFIPCRCPKCGHRFQAELGETRMAPSVERIVLPDEPSFTELSQSFAKGIADYGKGKAEEKRARVVALKAQVEDEPGFTCPECSAFAGANVKTILEKHAKPTARTGDIKKKDFGIESYHVYMTLLVHPDWLQGTPGSVNGVELGGWAGADLACTAAWYEERMKNLRLIEVRGRIRLADEDIAADEEDEEESLEGEAGDGEEAEVESDRKQYGIPRVLTLGDGTQIDTRKGTVPAKSSFACQSCGRPSDILDAVRPTGHTPPVMAYALQCHCPECDDEGYNYGGRYFIAPGTDDIDRLNYAEREWHTRAKAEGDLQEYWPRIELFPSFMTHRLNGGIPNWGYTHWWKMFNSRQLIVHASLLRVISTASDEDWHLDTREQALGAFQQYLRNQNLFVFWNPQRDTPEPMFSNANYHPQQLVIENSVFAQLGRGNWQSSSAKVVEGIEWDKEPWELVVGGNASGGKSDKVEPGDPVPMGLGEPYCASSTDLSFLDEGLYDLVITDPPFGNNLYYADLADFFYVWLRIPLLRWYAKYPEKAYFEPARTPHAMEAIENPVEHPDDRENWEKVPRINEREDLHIIRQLTGDNGLELGDPNPLFRRVPASDFYRTTLTACWAEANRLLKPGGLMAFTFHHSEDAPWVDVLEALFDAGYVLVATYPIRSDETKGATGAFGSRKIEYDIIHVCRKRLEEPQPVSWPQMRRWVKEEAEQLKDMLEHSHGKTLPESDLLVILRGKSLEYYSRHYGQVHTGRGELLGVRDAILGINQLLDDLLQGDGSEGRLRPPDSAEPATRLFLHIFHGRATLSRDALHKTLRGTGMAGDDLEARGWIKITGTMVHVISISEHFRYFTKPGRTRAVLKSDLDQAHFLIGAARDRSGVKISDELNSRTFRLKKGVADILQWYADTDASPDIRQQAKLALNLVKEWRVRTKATPEEEQLNLPDLEE